MHPATASGAIPSISGMAEANFAVIVKAYRDRVA